MSLQIQTLYDTAIDDNDTLTLAQEVDPERTFLLVSTTTTQSGNKGPEIWAVGAELTNRTTVTFNRGLASALAANAATVSVFVVTCTEQEFYVQRGSTLISNGTSSNTDAITAVDLSRSFVVHSTWIQSGFIGTANSYHSFVTGEITNSTTLTFTRSTTPTLRTFIAWEVVEWHPSTDVEVIRGTAALTGNIAAGTTVSLGETIDTSRSWLIPSFHHSTNGLEQCSIAATLQATNILAERGTTPNSYNSTMAWQVVKFPAGSNVTCSRAKGTTLSTDTTYDFTITHDSDRSVVMHTNTCYGLGTAFARPQWTARTISDSTIRFTRGYNGQTSEIAYQVVDLAKYRYSNPAGNLLAL